MPGRTGARQCATQPINYRCTYFMCVMYSWYLHPLCTVCTTIAPRVLHFSAVQFKCNGDLENSQGLYAVFNEKIPFAWATYNKCLRTTDCNFVCSLEHTALFMLSIHSPDNVFMVMVSIFISNHSHFCVLCFRLAAARATTALWRTEILNTVHYVRTVVQRRLYVSALRCSGTNKASCLPKFPYHVQCLLMLKMQSIS